MADQAWKDRHEFLLAELVSVQENLRSMLCKEVIPMPKPLKPDVQRAVLYTSVPGPTDPVTHFAMAEIAREIETAARKANDEEPLEYEPLPDWWYVGRKKPGEK